jgi:hypothetical protein
LQSPALRIELLALDGTVTVLKEKTRFSPVDHRRDNDEHPGTTVPEERSKTPKEQGVLSRCTLRQHDEGLDPIIFGTP